MKILKNSHNHTNRPQISVIMSVFNGKGYLEETIKSILNQTFQNLEFIIINDGSTDETPKILEKYKAQDARIKIIHQKNIGLTKSLNKGIKLSRGKYIARIDAGDLSLPDRLKEQIEFMENNPLVGATGCWYWLIDRNGKIIKERKPPTKFSKIKKSLLYSAPLIHPALLIRREVLEKVKFYDEEFKYAQDRDLLFRILRYYNLAVIPKFLLKYRCTKQSISLKNEIEQKTFCLKAIKKAIKNKIYPQWCYIFVLPSWISIHLPYPIRLFKNKIFIKLGIRREG